MAVLFLFSGCTLLKESPKYGFSEGYYYSRLHHKKLKKEYIVPSGDTIKIYAMKQLRKPTVDTVHSLTITFPQNSKPLHFEDYVFKKRSFDLDVLNVLMKLRPSVKDFPPQLNNNILNGAVYIGLRTDLYKLKYIHTPLRVDKRSIRHYGYSFGIFSGIGAAPVDEYVTLNAVNIQYDGVVNLTGIAALLALDNINFGLNLGVDHLLDKNRNKWIYQRKPWIGFSLGLNIN